jgi:hypothetical protein
MPRPAGRNVQPWVVSQEGLTVSRLAVDHAGVSMAKQIVHSHSLRLCSSSSLNRVKRPLRFELRLRWAARFALQLQSKHFAVMNCDHIRHTCAHTETFKDCGLNRVARATIWRMPRNEPRPTTRANMVKYRALNVVFWPGSSSHAGQPFPRQPIS